MRSRCGESERDHSHVLKARGHLDLPTETKTPAPRSFRQKKSHSGPAVSVARLALALTGVLREAADWRSNNEQLLSSPPTRPRVLYELRRDDV
jgi:hypothetical protein